MHLPTRSLFAPYNDMTAKEFLNQYKTAASRVRRLEIELEDERIMIDAIRSLSDNDGMPHGSGISKPTENKAVKLADKLIELVEARFDAIEIRREVFNVVIKVDGVPGDVLFDRYIKLMSWEQICDDTHYSWSWVHKYHRDGLEIVDGLIDKKLYRSIHAV